MSAPATTSSPTDVEQALLFAETHSQLYLSQKADDDSVTIDGCLHTADELLPRATTMAALVTLQQLHKEVSAPRSDPFRIFRVRDTPLYDSLKDRTSSDVEAMQTVANYLLLPKELSKALDEQAAVEEVKKAYKEAMASYNLVAATGEKPRLLQLLAEHPRTEALATAALHALYTFEAGHILEATWKWYIDWCQTLQISGTFRCPEIFDNSFLDGLTGEPLSEYGYLPSGKRIWAYSIAAVLMGRPVPWNVVAERTKNPDLFYCSDLLDSMAQMAAATGKIDVLEELEKQGWSVVDADPDKTNRVLREAARCDQLEVLKYFYGIKPEAFGSSGIALDVMCHATVSKDNVMLRWLLEEVGLSKCFAEIDNPGMHRVDRRGRIASDVAKSDDLPLLKQLHSYGAPLLSDVTSEAARLVNKEMLLWAVDQGCPVESSAVNNALCSGSWDMFFLCLDLLQDGEEASSIDLLPAACRGFKGNTQALEAVIKKVPAVTSCSLSSLVEAAAGEGFLPVLVWVKENLQRFTNRDGTPVDAAAIFAGGLSKAILRNQLEVLKWLVDELEPERKIFTGGVSSHVGWNISQHPFSKEAAILIHPLLKNGSLAFGNEACEAVLVGNSLPAATWLSSCGALRLEQGYDHTGSCGILEASSKWGASIIPLLEHLVRERVLPSPEAWPSALRLEPTAACRYAAKSGSLELLGYFLDKGCEAGPTLLTAAAEYNRVPLLRWLRATYPAWEWPADIVERARKEGADEAASWVLEQQAKEKAGKEASAGAGTV
jgi:hypothetical protein